MTQRTTSSTQTSWRRTLPSPGTGTAGENLTRRASTFTNAESRPPNMIDGRRIATDSTPEASMAASPRRRPARYGPGSPVVVSMPARCTILRTPAVRAALASAAGPSALTRS